LSAAAQKWQPVEVALAYRLGEIGLFSAHLRGFANRTHFTRVEPYAALPDPQVESGEIAGFYFYPTYPIAFEPPTVTRTGDWLVYTPYDFENYFIDLKAIGNFEAYLKKFSSKSRSTLLRKVRKFEEASGGAISWRAFSQRAEMEEFFSLALPLSDTTYQSRLLDSGLPRTPAFKEQAKTIAAGGGVRAFILFLRARPVAYVFCFCNEGIVTYDYVGYDSSASNLSPGTVLQYLMLQSLFSDPACSIFDFTEGEGAQKQFFSTDSRRCAKSYFLRRSLKNVCLVRLHQGLNAFVEGIGALLDRFEIKSRVRALIRRTA
jgi:CelD/BcsL family acetyltransferase involved in cellulose biosynthesis